MNKDLDINSLGLRYVFDSKLWAVKKEYIYAAIEAVQNGLEYANSILISHDDALGRTTKKNRMWAEVIENDIRQMRQTLEDLRKRCPEPVMLLD